jgi:hypothetical protein
MKKKKDISEAKEIQKEDEIPFEDDMIRIENGDNLLELNAEIIVEIIIKETSEDFKRRNKKANSEDSNES